jgi:hypothetical protein
MAAVEASGKQAVSSTLYLFGAYGIGKERVFMAVADALKMR